MHQDLEALTKDFDTCQFCGSKIGIIWGHYDSWTKWMRYGCGCNVYYCKNCESQGKSKSIQLKMENRSKAEAAEIKMLKEITPKQLPRLRSRYLNDFQAGEEFYQWVATHVGEEKANEYLKVPCDICGNHLGITKYTFEDKDGNRSLKTIDEIELYCYQVLNRDPESQPFIPNDAEVEIAFQSAAWDYQERNNIDHKDTSFNFRRLPDDFWSYGNFIYYMPTRTFLGKMTKRDGDAPQILQTNYDELSKEQKELRVKHDNKYTKEYWEELSVINAKQEWGYYCSKACLAQQHH